jgi:hypothetical protein
MQKILIIVFIILTSPYSFSQSRNVVIVIIDGARYTETFGDATHTYIPKMAAMAEEGALISEFYNDGFTYTSKAVPALWCGTWSGVQNIYYNGSNTQYTIDPSIFEYFRKQKNKPATQSIYELTSVSSLWLQSFHSDYGSDYWPYTVSQGSTDEEVVIQAKIDMSVYRPQLLWVYLPNVDHEGHSGIWDNYIGAIKTADSLVYDLWTSIQGDSFYKDNTTLLVTNDHGRHTTDFSGHGCDCEGCRHIMFLAIGPDVKKNFVSNTQRVLPDFAVTASFLLDVNPEFATGSVAYEIFVPGTGINKLSPKNIIITDKYCYFNLLKEQHISINLYDIQGKNIKQIFSGKLFPASHQLSYELNNLHGFFLMQIIGEEINYTQKLILP